MLSSKIRILVTGAGGLVGTDMVSVLQKKYGPDSVLATDINSPGSNFKGLFNKLDVRNNNQLGALIRKFKINWIFHLAGLLSAGGEKNPDLAWDVNLNGLRNILDLAVDSSIRIFWPSSIAVFGSNTPRLNTPQHTVLEPNTMYGITKTAGELLCLYYYSRFGVDVRSLRYPGLIAWKAAPGDGTTEYAVHIFHAAVRTNSYTCFLKPDTILPMMYIDDAVSGTLGLMAADKKNITVRTSYNFSALSFSPRELAQEIARQHPGFKCDYSPDRRQEIADSWPQTIDDSQARHDWGWEPKFFLPQLVNTMLKNLDK
jgi:nucleoside-diphosphate-sugar epimerase